MYTIDKYQSYIRVNFAIKRPIYSLLFWYSIFALPCTLICTVDIHTSLVNAEGTYHSISYATSSNATCDTQELNSLSKPRQKEC